jgi:hypothetical protein
MVDFQTIYRVTIFIGDINQIENTKDHNQYAHCVILLYVAKSVKLYWDNVLDVMINMRREWRRSEYESDRHRHRNCLSYNEVAW